MSDLKGCPLDGSNITVLRATEQPSTVRRRVEGVRSDAFPIIFPAESCPAEVCVSEQSQNAGELQSLVSLDYKYHLFFFKYF